MAVAVALDLVGVCVLLAVSMGWREVAGVLRAGSARGLLLTLLPVTAFTVPAFVTTVLVDLPPLSVRGDVAAGIAATPFVLCLAGVALLGRARRFSWPFASVTLVSVLASVLSIVHGQGWIQPVAGVVIALVIAALGPIPDARARLLVGARLAALLLAASMLLLVLVDPLHATAPCRADKCSLVGEVLVAKDSGNGIGLYMAMLLPFVLLGLRSWRTVIAAGGLLAFVDLTSGRAALLGAVAALGVLLIGLVPRLRRNAAYGLTALAVVVALGFVALAVPWNAAAFTTRGSLWIRAKELLATAPIVGRGPAFWSSQPITPTFDTNYGAHNTVLEVLVGVGVVGLILLLTSLLLVLVTVRPLVRWELCMLLVPVFASGFLESTLVPYRFSILFAALPTALMLVFARLADGEPAPPQRRGRRARRSTATAAVITAS